jgi:hypothetical protein
MEGGRGRERTRVVREIRVMGRGRERERVVRELKEWMDGGREGEGENEGGERN